MNYRRILNKLSVNIRLRVLGSFDRRRALSPGGDTLPQAARMSAGQALARPKREMELGSRKRFPVEIRVEFGLRFAFLPIRDWHGPHTFKAHTGVAADAPSATYELVADGPRSADKVGRRAVRRRARSGRTRWPAMRREAFRAHAAEQRRATAPPPRNDHRRPGSGCARGAPAGRGFLSNLALPDAWTEDFRSSEAYASLNGAMESLGISASPYALVMPCFQCTLKEVLETGAPAGREAAGGVRGERGRSRLRHSRASGFGGNGNAASPAWPRRSRRGCAPCMRRGSRTSMSIPPTS